MPETFRDVPDSRVIDPRPLRVYIQRSIDSDEYVLDPRASVQQLTRGSDGLISTAEIVVTTAPFLGETESLSPASVFAHQPAGDFAQYIHPDQRIMIARELPADAPNRQVLFSGFCDRPVYDQPESDGESSREMFALTVESVWKRQNQRPGAQIVGRWMRSAAAIESLAAHLAANPDDADQPFGIIEDLQHVDAYPCVFNKGGRPNRARTPLQVGIPTGGVDDEGNEVIQLHTLYVFTHERDPDAQFWTWAQVLRYLIFFHLFDNPLQIQDADALAANLVQDGNVFAVTDAPCSRDEAKKIIEGDQDDRPASPVDTAHALEHALLSRPGSFACDAMTLGEALNLLAEAAGLHYCVRTTAETQQAIDDNGDPQTDDDGNPVMVQTGRPIDQLFIWARGAGEPKSFFRWGRFDDPVGRDPAEVLTENNIVAMRLEQDYTDVVTHPVILGDVERYECTMQLVPGWEPDPVLDDVPQAQWPERREYALQHEGLDSEELAEDEWYRRYHKKGAEFAAYRTVCRRWVLNEDGRYPAVDSDGNRVYARELGWYGADAYKPWRPTMCGIKRPTIEIVDGEATVVKTPVGETEWTLRPRPLHQCLSADADGQSMGIVVEVSAETEVVDGVATPINWVRLTGVPIISLSDHASIYIDVDDLTQVRPWGEDLLDGGGEPLNLWTAMLERRLLVRVTAVIEGDHRCTPALPADTFRAGVQEARAKIFDLSDKYGCNRRDCANSVLAEDGETPAPSSVREATTDRDLLDLQRAGEAILEVCSARAQPGLLVIPWISEDYQVGDTIRRIEGMDITFWSHGDTRLERARHPDIVAIRNTPTRTYVILEDTRLLDLLDSGAMRIERPTIQTGGGRTMEDA